MTFPGMANMFITGHTSGLGQELMNLYPCACGLSRSNGYDISTVIGRQRIVERTKHGSIFINNAHSGFSQVNLLYQILPYWDNPNQTIVNISSISPETSIHRLHLYSVEKHALDVAVEQVSVNVKSRVILIKPGLFESNRSAFINGNKLKASYVANKIKDFIETSDKDKLVIDK